MRAERHAAVLVWANRFHADNRNELLPIPPEVFLHPFLVAVRVFYNFAFLVHVALPPAFYVLVVKPAAFRPVVVVFEAALIAAVNH